MGAHQLSQDIQVNVTTSSYHSTGLAMDSKLVLVVCCVTVLLFGRSSGKTVVDGYACPSRDQDFYGNDIVASACGIPVASWEACGKLCESVVNCQVWTYYDSTECPKGCYLKSSERGLKYAEGRISGAKHYS